MTALEVLTEEGMIENSRVQGDRLKSQLEEIKQPFVKEVRGKGLMTAIE